MTLVPEVPYHGRCWHVELSLLKGIGAKHMSNFAALYWQLWHLSIKKYSTEPKKKKPQNNQVINQSIIETLHFTLISLIKTFLCL
jgi:hypothetical protein